MGRKPASPPTLEQLHEALREERERNRALWDELRQTRPGVDGQRFDSLRDYIGRVNDERRTLRSRLDELTERLSRSAPRAHLQALRDELSQVKAELRRSQRARRSQRLELQEAQAAPQDDEALARLQLESEATIAALRGELQRAVSRDAGRIAALRQELALIKPRHETELAAARSESALQQREQGEQIAALRAEVARRQRENTAQRENLHRELTRLRSRYEGQIATLQSEGEHQQVEAGARLAALQRELARQRRENETQLHLFHQKTARLRRHYDARDATRREEIQLAFADGDARVQALQSEIQSLRAQLAFATRGRMRAAWPPGESAPRAAAAPSAETAPAQVRLALKPSPKVAG